MLVLSRRKNETIVIGGEVEITVLSIQGNKVSLGISAPLHVRVDRKELAIRDESARREKAECEERAPVAAAI